MLAVHPVFFVVVGKSCILFAVPVGSSYFLSGLVMSAWNSGIIWRVFVLRPRVVLPPGEYFYASRQGPTKLQFFLFVCRVIKNSCHDKKTPVMT